MKKRILLGGLSALALAIAGIVMIPWMKPAHGLVLTNGNESCRIDPVGGRILSYQVDGTEVLWNDDPPQRTAPDWAHGGIPLCWPWFGDDGRGNIHGTAWRRTFGVVKGWSTDQSCGRELALREGDLKLVYDVTLRDGLLLEARVKNLGATNCTFTLGFHPYFRAEDRDRVSVVGLDGLSYEDDPSFPHPEKGVWKGALCVTNYVDRIFGISTNGICVRVGGVRADADLELTGCNFTGLNVWNPGAEKNCPGVIPGESWRRFVCVEPVRCAPSGTVCLKPGETTAFLFAIRLLKR